MVSVNKELLDAILRHQHYLQRMYAHQVNTMLANLNGVVYRHLLKNIRETFESLERLGFGIEFIKRQALHEMFRTNIRILREGYREVHKLLTGELKSVAELESAWTMELLKHTIPDAFGVSFTAVSTATLTAIATSKPFETGLLADWYSDQAANVQKLLKTGINNALTEGATVPEMTRMIRGTKAMGYRDGILSVPRYQAEAIARTATAHVVNNARMATYEANEDVISGWQFVATLDDRTTFTCMSLDGNTYKLGEGAADYPPLHHQCRSTTVPITKSWEELGIKGIKEAPESTRASMNGQVPGKVNYEQWLKTQSVEFQNDALGKKRAELFRGGMSIDKFVDRKHMPLTLEELYNLEGVKA